MLAVVNFLVDAVVSLATPGVVKLPGSGSWVPIRVGSIIEGRVISLLLKTDVRFDKYGMFLLGVVGQTLANSLMAYGGKGEDRGRDLVSKLDLWDVIMVVIL